MASSSKEMELAIKIAGKVESSFTGALSAAGNGIKGLTKTIAAATTAAAAAVGAIAVASVNVGKEFETAMSQVQATMLLDTGTAEGAAAMATLEEAARECGRTTAFSATEAAEALNYLALAGYDAEQAATALPTVLKLAGAGAMDLAAASDMVTDSMSALQIEATEENLNSFADQLAQTASKANTSVAQLGEAILTVGATGANLAGGTAELNTALGILADNGLKGAEGGTHLRNVILSLQSPTDNASAALKSLGVDVYDAEGNMRGLNNIFGDLSSAMEGMTQAQKDNIISTIFNKTDLTSANALLANCTDRWDELSAAIENSAGACEDMYSIQLDNLDGDIKILQSGLSDLGISIYKDLNGPMRSMTQLATGMVEELSAAYSEGGLQGMVGAIGGCLSEAVGVISEYVPQVVSMGVDLIGSFVQGIVDNAGTLADTAAQTLTVFVNGLFSLVPQVLLAGIEIIAQLAISITSQLPTLINNGIQAIINFVSGIISMLPQLLSIGVQVITNLISGITQMLPMIIQGGVQLISALIQGILENLPSIIQAAITIILSLLGGLISAIPQLLTIIPMIFSAIWDGITGADWPAIGVNLIKSIGQGIIDGAVSIGTSVVNTVKGWFGGGGNDSDVSAEGMAATVSYATGISSNAEAVTAAANNMATGAFSNMDTSGATTAGTAAGAAYTTGMTDALNGFTFDTSGMGLDSAALSTSLSETGAESGTAFTTSLDNSISAYTFDTSSIGVDTSALTSNMTAAGTAGGTALTTGLNQSVTGYTIDTTGIAINTAGLESSLTTAGTAGTTALSNGMSSNAGTVTAAATSLAGDVNGALDSGWNTAQSSAESAMSSLVNTVQTKAQAAAQAVKSAFENMTITIPKPRIPVISVSTSSVSYGEGGSVSIPQFSVNWNALGGIFDAPTVFNTPGNGLQGVGEAGPEAVLPLDTLWSQMKSILTDAMKQNSGASIIESLLQRLQGITSGGGGGDGGPELAGAGGPNISYSPTYNLYGNATKEDAVEAERMSQAEFNKMMKQWKKENSRTKF